MQATRVTIVATLYKSRDFIVPFFDRMSKEVSKFTTNFDFIFVNDGSPDDSYHIALALTKQHSNVTLVDLSRNFGHHRAIVCGLEASKGDLVFLTDIDLEEPPEDFSKYWSEFHSSITTDVVFGQQITRKGKIFERCSGWIFYTLLNILSDINIKRNIVMSRLMSRRYVDSLIMFQESELMLAGVFELAGFEQKSILVHKDDKGSSSYTFQRKIALLINAVTSLSSKPLYWAFYAGLGIVSVSIIFIVYLIAHRLIVNSVISGWSSLMVSIWFLSGVILTSSGLLSIYLSKVFLEVKRRPRYIIRNIFPSSQSGDTRS